MSNLAPAVAHAAHDLLLVAALADRELAGPEYGRARAQVDACADCAALHADLRALAVATHELPAIPRPREFTLRPQDAERLRPNLVRRLLGSLGTARDGISRPLAMGFTTLGLAGLLVGVVPGALSSGAAGASSAPEAARLEAMSSAPAATRQYDAADGGTGSNPQQEYGAPAASSGSALAGGQGEDSDFFANGDEAADPSVSLAPDSTGVSLPIVLSGSLLIVGLGLFALRWTSRRFGG
jgi:hypothetical protein